MTQVDAPAFIPPMDDDTVEIQDFTIKRKRIGFRIDDDVFTASTVLSIPTMQNLIKLGKNMSNIVENDNYDEIQSIFAEILLEDSARRFNERMMKKGDDGIDVQRQVIPVLHWLMEKFGLRPTQPSSDSSTGLPSGTDGITSTAGSSAVVSTLSS